MIVPIKAKGLEFSSSLRPPKIAAHCNIFATIAINPAILAAIVLISVSLCFT